MALLKSGSTVGGNLIWHQGLLPLFPSNNELYYKDFMVFTQNNKPNKNDVGLNNVSNDAQVKKAGDTMTGDLRLTTPGDTRFRLKDVEFRSNAANQLVISTPSQAIHIRPKGNDIADQQVIIDTNGTISADRVITRSDQPGDAGSLTRKDYVDTKVSAVEQTAANLANTKVAKAGDTMTGNLTAPVFLVSAGQNTSANALTRKDYVDGRANEKVAKAGDTMTGLLSAAQGISPTNVGGSWASNGIFPGSGDGATWDKVNWDITSWYGIGIKSSQGDAPRTIVINARNGDLSSKGLITSNTMSTERISVNSLTRKTGGGTFLANDGNINLQFASGTHASGFVNGYLLEQIGNKLNTKLTKAIQLDKRNLNDITEVGIYEQHANANTPNLNYPENLAGSLTITSGAGVQQTYHIYNSSRVWRRAKYGTEAWTPWRQGFNYGDGALAIGFVGVSGLGANSIAIGDNDTGIKQDGDGNFEIWANSQRVARMTSGNATFDKPINITGDTNVYNNGAFNFIKAGANPRNIRLYHGGNASRGGRLEISGESSYLAYFEERPDNSHHIIMNGRLAVGGQIASNSNGPGFVVNATASNQSCYFLGQRAGANGFYVGLGSSDNTVTFHNYLLNTNIQLRPSDIYANRTIYCDGDGNFNNVYIRSDERLKTNFKPILNAVEKVEKLDGLVYDKKLSMDAEDYTETEAGIIAQSLRDVLPEAVSEKEGVLNVSSSGLNALLVNAIKELSARVKYLESK